MTDLPFIQRRFDLGTDQTIVVTWRQPKQDDQCWRCDYLIEWPERDYRSRAFGNDAVQALVLALTKAHVELLCSDEGKARQITLHGDRDLDLPLTKTMNREDFD